VLPKGNIDPGLTAAAAAAIEAEEEAGVRGDVATSAVGRYRYRKRYFAGLSRIVEVEVYPIAVTNVMDDWKEREQRERRWFTLEAAAEAVDEPDLKTLLRGFRPAS
jgi:uncharacterized protein